LGGIQLKRQDTLLAIKTFERSLLLYEDLEDQNGIAICWQSLAEIYFNLGDFQRAKGLSESSLILSKQLGFPKEIRDASEILYKMYKEQNNWKEALGMHEQFIEMKDSVWNEERTKSTIRQQYKYTYEKQTSADSIVQADALALMDVEAEKKDIELSNEKQQKLYLYLVLGLVALFTLFLYNRFKVTQKQKDIIDEQKKIVEQQKSDVEEKKHKIELQHFELEEIHKGMSDSIKYAQRLQQAILPTLESMKDNLGKGFVVFEPKDVVSGDFYWMQKIGDTVLFAAADCTGHGVPGAMVSVVCSNALNRSVKEFNLIEPNDILNKTRELVIETFARSGKEVRDGMDIALCALSNNKLIYAGANNPLWILRNSDLLTDVEKGERRTISEGNRTLIEYKANKQPIGSYENMNDFEQIEIPIFEGDSLYLFTDGFADQFGGVRGKKFKYLPLKQLLLEIDHLSMDDQKNAIMQSFNSWKGNFEQVDDVCIIGVKL
jgi:serine phosphatase RsbU (regulator of sigma subunit)